MSRLTGQDNQGSTRRRLQVGIWQGKGQSGDEDPELGVSPVSEDRAFSMAPHGMVRGSPGAHRQPLWERGRKGLHFPPS